MTKRTEFDVLDLAARAVGLARPAHRDVAVAAQRALLHVAVAGAEIAQDRAQFAQIEPGLLGAAHIGLGDDLHQPDAGAVEIDIGLRRMLVVQALAGILLEMQPGDADLARRAVRHVEHEPAAPDDRLLVLRDLIAGRQVGIEIILAVEHAEQIDLGVEAEPGPDRLLDAMPVDDRQHAGKRGIDRSRPGCSARPRTRSRRRKTVLPAAITWAWTSSPITISQAPVRPSIRSDIAVISRV